MSEPAESDVAWWRWGTALLFVLFSVFSLLWTFGPHSWVSTAGMLPLTLIIRGSNNPSSGWVAIALWTFNWACYAALGALLGGWLGHALERRKRRRA